MQQINEKDGGDGIFKNGETGCSGQNREREMRCGSESLRNPSSSPGHSSSMTHSLVLLAKVRRRNESMLHVGFSYGARKKLLTEFATRERTKAISASTKTREPSLCAT